MTSLRVLGVVLLLALAPSASLAQGSAGVLSLDGLSFISFEGYENLAIPSGSTIRFQFGTPQPDGSVSFTIAPEDVQIGEIPLWSSSARLRYTLASAAHGTARKMASGVEVELSFSAPVRATLIQEGAGGSYSYTLTFTTETTSASNASGSSVSIEGMRLVVGANHVQLAGATVNRTNAFPEPGRVVYTVLSGTFDQFPTLP